MFFDIKNEKYEVLDSTILLGLGGSHAYGTNIETSDIDLRGVALPSADEILLSKDFKQKIYKPDTVIYSLAKFVHLCTNCNPNVIELLGLKDYIYLSHIGKELIDNSDMFLSKRAISSFGGYASAQLRKLDSNVYSKRNEYAEVHGKLAKHMMHLVRLYFTCYDILEHGEIITYREKEHDFLMDVRNGKFLDSNTVKPEFFELVKELDAKLNNLAKTTILPEKPDYDRINEFLLDTNYTIIRNSYSYTRH